MTSARKGKRERETRDALPDLEEGSPTKRPKPKLGGRGRHALSDGESDSEDPTVLYRALRKNEPDPFEHGLKPPEGFNPDITATQHITSGSRAVEKSPWISSSRSKKVASAWSVKSGGEGRVVKFTKPQDGQSYDLTDRTQAAQVFPKLSGSSYNTAKASQEVVIHGHVPKENIRDVFQTKKVSVKQYASTVADDSTQKIRSRTTTSSTPTPVILTRTSRAVTTTPLTPMPAKTPRSKGSK